MRHVWIAVLVLVGLGAAPVAAQTTEPVGLGIRLLDAPIERRDDPRAQVYVVDHVEAGTVIERRVEVTNGTLSAGTVSLYPAASEVADGSFSVGEGRAVNELTGWTTVTPAQLVLAPGESGTALARIAVPAGAGGGERYAAVMAEIVEGAGAPGVAVASRVGIRVYLSIGGDAEPPSDFEITTLQAQRRSDGTSAVVAQVDNTGERALDMSGTLALADGPGGLSAGPFAAELGTTLAPGNSSPVVVVLDKAISGGPWRATLTLRSGSLERRAEATVTFPDQAGAQADVVPATDLSLAEDPRVVIPFAIALISLLALVLLVVGYLTSRRRAREKSAG